jgi:predicted transcriptional regulator
MLEMQQSPPLEMPDLPEVMTIGNDEIDSLSPPVAEHPNSSASKTASRPSNWDVNVAKRFMGKVIDTSGWSYFPQFKALNMYERLHNVCADCLGPIGQCINNETRQFGPLDWQKYYKAMAPKEEESIDPETGEAIVTLTPTGRMPKGSFKQAVNPDDQKAMKDAYTSGATLQEVSLQFMTAPKLVRDFLAEEGVLRKRGESTGKVKEVVEGEPVARRGRVRSTIDLTEEIIVSALKRAQNGEGVTALAKEENVNQVELSTALKERGLVVTKGKKKTTFDITPEMISKAKVLVENGKGVVALAQELNVNPVLLSNALKDAGVAIRKGKQKGCAPPVRKVIK